MIKTRTKPIYKNHFNLSTKEISSYRKYIRNLVNKKWMKQIKQNTLDDCDNTKIQFTENQIFHFIPSSAEFVKQILPKSPSKGILKTY